jgi:branched-chain amino acid transport system ATP-binding protein
MLELKGVTGGYGLAPVIHGVDLIVNAGETVAVLGPNGAGKSTLLGAITGTIRQRGGSIKFAGREIVREPSHAIVSAGLVMVPEGRQIFAPFTVADNLRLGAVRLKANGKHSLDERYGYVYKLFPRLYERRKQLAGTLSGGEQQMLAIGRALMSAPRMLLLDEPFLGLAPLIVAEIRRALDALKSENFTILLVEQKLDIALAAAARAYVMIKGGVALESSTAELAKRPDLNQLYFALAESPLALGRGGRG